MKAIIFDLDQTLIDRTETVRKFLNDQYIRFDTELSCSQESFVTTVMHNQKNGYADKLIAYEESMQELTESVEAEALFTDFKATYGLDGVLFPGIKEMLAQVSEHYVLAMITNGRSKGQNAKIDSEGIRQYFQVIKVSEEEGIKKPNEEIYLRCLADLGLSAEECIFIGDHPQSDVATPKKLGMKAIWIRSEHYDEPEEADLVIDCASDLIGHLNSELFLQD
ncbi:HAD family hydrolase [Leucothrix arctica]|uniref:HAD family hydrolase n=1 Tax=Leucothrix arctica TaxID=1481894 RepID=A0A317CQ31_9GAMM|nr:HAD family hydrolase [Leucothrix arctica]PWQ98402.1 HAD family hydrolase [Leucothrix arctica]